MAGVGDTGGVGRDTGHEQPSSSTDKKPPHQPQSTSSVCLSSPKSLVSHDGIATTVEVTDMDKSINIQGATGTTKPHSTIVNVANFHHLQYEEMIATSHSEEHAQKDVNIRRSNYNRVAHKQQQVIIKPQREDEIYDRDLDEDLKIESLSIIQESPTPATEKAPQRVSSPDTCRSTEETTEFMRLSFEQLSRMFSTEKYHASADFSHGILPWVIQCKNRKDGKTVHRSPVFQTHGTEVTFRAKLFLEGYGKGAKTHFSLHITRKDYLEEDTMCSVKVQVLNHNDIGKTKQFENNFKLNLLNNAIKIDQLIEICQATDENLGYNVNNIVVVIITVDEVTKP